MIPSIEKIEKLVEKNKICFVAGSLIEGIGNKYSDLDIFVIVETDEEFKSIEGVYSSKFIKYDFKEVEGISCDIEYWPLKTIEILFDKIKKVDFNNKNLKNLNALLIEGYNFEEITTLLNRMNNSKNIGDINKYNHLIKNFPKEKYYKLMTRVYINRVDNMYSDIIGNIEINELNTAGILAKTLLEETALAFLFSKKLSLDRHKWIFKKLNILKNIDNNVISIVDNFENFYFNKNLNNLNNIEDTLDFVNCVIQNIGDRLENEEEKC